MATRPQAAIVATADTEARSYMEWGAIIAGTIVAAALSLILLTFGSAIGLSMASPYEDAGASKAVFAIVLALWVLWVIVFSNLAGGYIAGRMRRRTFDATEHESDIRDGAHGLVMWGLGVLLAALMALAGVTGLAWGGSKVVGAAAGASRDATATTVDQMFRPAANAPAATDRNPGADREVRREVTRIVAKGTAGQPIADDDKAYVSRLVAQRTGLSQDEATRRVDDALAKAKQAANAARKAGIVSGFLIAAALLVGAAAAWWAAIIGGRHRDQGTDVSGFPFG
jgi:hypothetical protein